jgi:hypothetical protein
MLDYIWAWTMTSVRRAGINNQSRNVLLNQRPTFLFVSCHHEDRSAVKAAGLTNRTLRYMVRSDGMAGVEDRTLRGLSAGRIAELMDSRTFKASRSRGVNDTELRINVCPSPRPAPASKGCWQGSWQGGSKCSAGLAFQALRLFEVFCLLRRRSASLRKNRAVEYGARVRAVAKLSPKPGRRVENPAWEAGKKGQKG